MVALSECESDVSAEHRYGAVPLNLNDAVAIATGRIAVGSNVICSPIALDSHPVEGGR